MKTEHREPGLGSLAAEVTLPRHHHSGSVSLEAKRGALKSSSQLALTLLADVSSYRGSQLCTTLSSDLISTFQFYITHPWWGCICVCEGGVQVCLLTKGL